MPNMFENGMRVLDLSPLPEAQHGRDEPQIKELMGQGIPVLIDGPNGESGKYIVLPVRVYYDYRDTSKASTAWNKLTIEQKKSMIPGSLKLADFLRKLIKSNND